MNIQKNISLKTHNTFGIDVKASLYTEFENTEDLKNVLTQFKNEKILILGGGSNMLFTKDFDGLVLKNKIRGIAVEKENDEQITLKTGAGEVWHELVMFCVNHNYGGIENLSLIPGTVGAAPIQNIGAYGVEQKDTFYALEAFELETQNIRLFNTEECKFGYRDSIFKHTAKGKFVITHVYYTLEKNPKKLNTSYGNIKDELEKNGISNPTIKDISNAVINIRQSKLPDPNKIGNAGSFFKNPLVTTFKFETLQKEFGQVPSYPAEKGFVKIPAGWLIEKAGWKGKDLGTYGVHNQQALVLVNKGGAKGKDIKKLAFSILDDISNKFGIDLEPEVNIL